MLRLNTFRKIGHTIASPAILFWLLPLIMLWLVAGTIAQATISLYDALDVFFTGWFIWVPVLDHVMIPVPGAYILLGAFFINLLARFVLKTEWQWKKCGIYLSHFGVLLLFIGGGVATLTNQEGYAIIPESGEVHYFSDYNQRVLAIFDGAQSIAVLPVEELRDALGIPIAIGDATITPQSYCRNCAITERNDPKDNSYQGMAEFMRLENKAPETADEANMEGLTFTIEGSVDNDGTYIAFEGMPKPITIDTGEQTLDILLGKKQTPLPFSLELLDFEKQLHPGTNLASAYSSTLVIHDQDVSWPVKISMNKPVRYKGYSLYQSAFEQYENGTVASVLAINKNIGGIFPYLALLSLGAGLILHLVLVRGKDTQ